MYADRPGIPSELQMWIGAVESQEIPAGPSPSLVSRTRMRLNNQRKEVVRRHQPLRQASQALMVLAASLLICFLIPFSASPSTFAGVQENVKVAESVACVASYEFLGWKIAMKVTMQGEHLRFEDQTRAYNGSLMSVKAEDREKRTIVLDLAARKMLTLKLDKKTAQIGAIPPSEANTWANPVAQIHRLITASAKLIGQERLNGETVNHFVVKGADSLGAPLDHLCDVHLWSNEATKLPIKIEIRDSKTADVVIRFTDLVWNKRMDASLFQLTAPPEYRLLPYP